MKGGSYRTLVSILKDGESSQIDQGIPVGLMTSFIRNLSIELQKYFLYKQNKKKIARLMMVRLYSKRDQLDSSEH